jgi:hypothetical protein
LIDFKLYQLLTYCCPLLPKLIAGAKQCLLDLLIHFLYSCIPFFEPNIEVLQFLSPISCGGIQEKR